MGSLLKIGSLFLVSLAVFVMGRPSGDMMTEEEFTNLVFTVDKLDQILKAYEPYKQFMPAYVWDLVDNITEEQKTQVVQMVNDYHAGKFEPKNFNELMDVMTKSYPALAEPYKKMYGQYQEQLAKLGPKAQEYANKLEAQMYADASPDRIIWACHLFNNAQSSIAGAKALLLDDSEAKAIGEAFPEAIKFLNSDEFEAYSIVVKNLQPLDCEKDRQQIFNTILLMDQKNVLAKKD